MDQLMSLQVASWNIGFTTVISDVSYLSTKVRFMHFQVNNPGKGITTDLADICFLPIIDQFTNAQLLWQTNKQTAIAKVYSVTPIHQICLFVLSDCQTSNLCYSEMRKNAQVKLSGNSKGTITVWQKKNLSSTRWYFFCRAFQIFHFFYF